MPRLDLFRSATTICVAIWTRATAVNVRHVIRSLGRIQFISDPACLAKGNNSQLFADCVDGASTCKNALSVAANASPEQMRRVQTILARAK